MSSSIYDNKIMIASWREKFAVIIESEEIAAGQKKIFELAWEGAKKTPNMELVAKKIILDSRSGSAS